MLGFVQSMFAPRTNPVGVDFGTDCLRLAQVQRIGGDYKLVAAASADVPRHIRRNPEARLAFFSRNVRELMSLAPFRGRQAVLGLPAAVTHIQHLRLAPMNEQELEKSITTALAGQLPTDPSRALMRHVVAGQIQGGGESKIEVIVMTAGREWVSAYLSAAAQARLDVIGMNTEPMALVDCFAHVHRRTSDQDSTRLLVDIGSSGTQAMIARNGKLLFARNIPIGGDHLTRATAEALRIDFQEARTLRIKLAAVETPVRPAEEQSSLSPEGGIAVERRMAREVLSDGATAVLEAPTQDDQADQVEQACRETMNQLVGELDLCRQYHEAGFASLPVERLVFVGGEARQRGVCQAVARQMGMAGQLGDPLCRMARTSEVGVESGIDLRTPQPAWSVAVGLSMGSMGD